MKTFALYLILAGILFSCQSETRQTEKSTIITREDSLYKAVIALHDEAMPKIGKLKGYQKTMEARIDSLNKVLSHKKDATTQKLKGEYESLVAQLKAAEKGMNDWMDSFQPDPKLPSKSDLEKYWTEQKAGAQKMRDDIINAIDSSKAWLKD